MRYKKKLKTTPSTSQPNLKKKLIFFLERDKTSKKKLTPSLKTSSSAKWSKNAFSNYSVWNPLYSENTIIWFLSNSVLIILIYQLGKHEILPNPIYTAIFLGWDLIVSSLNSSLIPIFGVSKYLTLRFTADKKNNVKSTTYRKTPTLNTANCAHVPKTPQLLSFFEVKAARTSFKKNCRGFKKVVTSSNSSHITKPYATLRDLNYYPLLEKYDSNTPLKNLEVVAKAKASERWNYTYSPLNKSDFVSITRFISTYNSPTPGQNYIWLLKRPYFTSKIKTPHVVKQLTKSVLPPIRTTARVSVNVNPTYHTQVTYNLTNYLKLYSVNSTKVVKNFPIFYNFSVTGVKFNHRQVKQKGLLKRLYIATSDKI